MSKFIYVIDWVVDLDHYSDQGLHEIVDELTGAVEAVEDEITRREKE